MQSLISLITPIIIIVKSRNMIISLASCLMWLFFAWLIEKSWWDFVTRTTMRSQLNLIMPRSLSCFSLIVTPLIILTTSDILCKALIQIRRQTQWPICVFSFLLAITETNTFLVVQNLGYESKNTMLSPIQICFYFNANTLKLINKQFLGLSTICIHA